MSGELSAHLHRLIRADGPIPLSRFMAEALGHPRFGYYMRRDPLGADGDFTTAPEISQMFGELLGLWCADLWQRSGAPATVRLVELGPGRGSLMADALRASAVLPAFAAAVDVHLVETSPALRRRQRATLADLEVHWHTSLADVPPGPSLVIANEFFDALPIRQYDRTDDGWRERFVALDGDGLAMIAGAELLPVDALPPAFRAARPGEVAELAPARDAIMRQLGERLVSDGGAAVVVDYGHARSHPGDTLQAVRNHAFAPVLDAPGEADLTAHVDFAALADAARAAGARVHGPVTQAGFLEALGLAPRTAALKASASPRQAADIEAAVARLTDPAQMGELFKVLAIAGPDMPAPAGFASDEGER